MRYGVSHAGGAGIASSNRDPDFKVSRLKEIPDGQDAVYPGATKAGCLKHFPADRPSLPGLINQPIIMKFEIKNRFTGKLIFEFDGVNIKVAVEAAVSQKVILSEAYLRGADLSGAYL